MVVKIFKTNSDVTKIEVHGHAKNNIVCAGFSSLFQFIAFELEKNILDVAIKSEGQIKVLKNFKVNIYRNHLLKSFEEYCILLKNQHGLNLEVINK